MAVIGVGLGSFMQIMTLAIQNSVDRRELGTATSAATFFRSLGSSFGGAIFGSILISRLTQHLIATLPKGSGAAHISISSIQSGAGLSHLPPATAHLVLEAFVRSFHDMFILTIPFALLAFVVAFFLREAPLRGANEPVLNEL
jgi:MFS family permease